MSVRQPIRRSSLLTVCLFVPCLLQAGDLIVLRSDNRSIVVEYRPEYTALRTVSAAGRSYVLQDFLGSTTLPAHAAAGSPDVRCRFIPLAFPGPRQNTVQIVAADYEDVHDVSPAPVPLVRMSGGLAGAVSYQADPLRYAVDGFVPGTAAELGPIGRVRDMLLGGVRVAPVQFNPVSRTMRKYSRIVIEVTYGPQAAGLPRRGEDRLLKDVPLNYAAARTWGSASLASTPPPVSSVLASGDWYRLTVTEDGMYRLDAAYLSSLGINVSSMDPRKIQIFGNGGTEVPEDLALPRPTDLAEDAIYVAGEADGKFDSGDYVVFYGRGPRSWTYDATGRTLRHYLNHYSEVNYYWLTIGNTNGKRMVEQPSLSSSPTDLVVEKFVDGVVLEEEKVNLLGSGKDWYGQSLSPGNSFTYVTVLPGLVPTGQIRYRYTLVGQSENLSSFTVSQSGKPLGTYGLGPIYGYTIANAATFEATGSSALANNTSQLNFQYNASDISAAGWIDWVEILYPRMLWAVNDSLRFRAPDTSAVVEYHLQQFSATPMVFNVSAHADVRLVTGIGGSFLFRAAETVGSPSAYCAVAGTAWRVPKSAAKMPNENVRGFADGADFIIVTSPEYRSAADRLKAYRENAANGGLKTYVADVNEIYNEFGGGLSDITAIRDFLKYAYDRWSPRPQFVLMLGQGSYDYKGILGSRSSFVPTWQSSESRDDVESYATDDFFGKFGGTDVVSLVLGRVSARSRAEAEAFVDKLQRYESHSAVDSWKMRMLFIADDAWTPEGGEVGDRTLHSDDAETLASSFYSPDEFEKKKIFIAEYPTVWNAQGRRKPGAYQAIIDQINQGSLIVNYAGHGNPTQLAHENIFNVATSIPQLVNADRLAVFFLATCNFSQFDDPKRYTGSEILVNKADGGAIGVVSADRKVYAGANAALNQGTYRRLFTRDSFGRVVVDRPATALYLYKASYGNYVNDQKFFFMGDPTMRLQYPRRYAAIDSINSLAPDSGGVPRSVPVQLRSLGRVYVKGTIRDANNQVDPSYNGRMQLIVNDATRTQTIVDFYPGVNFNYVATGGTIYRGENSVQNGHFSASFIVPKDIQFADSLARGRLVTYVHRDDDITADAAGYTSGIRIGGTDTSIVNTHAGPKIDIYLGNRSFRPGDLVGEHPALLVDFADSAGINTSSSGIGHRIEAWVNSSTQSKDLTDYYTSALDNFRQGTVQYQLSDLPQGKNTIRIRAWDSFNNSSTGETYFSVASSGALSVSDVFNYPNPFGAAGTDFTFRQNQSVPLNITVKVFTVGGRLIQTLETYSSGDSFVRVPWDGRDRDGDVIANGVYLYKLIVKTADGAYSSEVLGKLSKVQ